MAQSRFSTTQWLALSIFGAACTLVGCGSSELGTETHEVTLAYGEGSNHGAQNATGSATVNGGTGQVDITVKDLPMLGDDERFEGWLAGGDEDPLSTGRFNTDQTGVGSSTIVLGDLSSRTFETVVITVEPEPDPSPKPDPRHSIEGEID